MKDNHRVYRMTILALSYTGREPCIHGISILQLRVHGSAFDRALEQRRDDLALENHEDDESGHQEQDRAGAQQGDVVRVVALERSQPTSHRSLRRILDEHQGKEKLVPRPDGCEYPERSDRRPRQWDVNAPE